jgi:hypothetical protein
MFEHCLSILAIGERILRGFRLEEITVERIFVGNRKYSLSPTKTRLCFKEKSD